MLKVEASLPPSDANLDFLTEIEKFKPFGIANPKPLWLFKNVTILDVQFLGEEKKHIKIFLKESPNLPILMWNAEEFFQYFLSNLYQVFLSQEEVHE